MEQPDYGAFTAYFEMNGGNLCLFIHPEMYPEKHGIAPTGRYFIYCIHPDKGSCHFIVEQNNLYAWFSQNYPPFIEENLIAWIGNRIELKNKNL